MFVFILIVCLIQFQVIHNTENGCGCSLSREHNKPSKSNILQLLPLEVNQCPKKYEMDNVYSEYFLRNIVLIPSGDYQFGTDDVMIEGDREGPKRIVKLKSFYLDKYEVSNKDFSSFVEETQYKTEAETFGDSFVFTLFLNNTFKEQLEDFRVVQAPWWYKVMGTNWRHPYGPDSDLSDMMDHPVIHVSWNDARAYCAWRHARLPTEAEWEAACRGGHSDYKYPWGDKLFPNHTHMANIWQGSFPHHNSVKDGYIGTNEVNLFPPNDFDLYNMAGNVWEWTEDPWTEKNTLEKVKKGGSHLCHRSYCYRYRCSARSQNTADSSAGNLGFRCAKTA